jgi:DNA processing protein
VPRTIPSRTREAFETSRSGSGPGEGSERHEAATRPADALRPSAGEGTTAGTPEAVTSGVAPAPASVAPVRAPATGPALATASAFQPEMLPGLAPAAGGEKSSTVGPSPGGCEDAERLARAGLARLVEPGDEVVGEWVNQLGAVEVLRRIARGEELPRVRATRLENYRVRLPDVDPRADLDRLRALGGRLVCPGDTEWPSQLDDLGPARPLCLWVRGAASLRLLALRSVAVVGARACTDYGAHAAAELAAELARGGWIVVSGAAYGIDAAAHRGALAVTGTTIAVLACGVDTVYPPGHQALCARIAEQGLLVSELPPGQHPTRSRFVLRNRVIAALTRGTVVVEAATRSGALSTARRAGELNRHVMGVPGPCFSELSVGVHAMIRTGATLVSDAAEVIELIGGIGTDLAPQRQGPVLPRDLLSPDAARVLDALPAGPDGVPLEAVARAAGLGSDPVLRHLYELASLGFVQRRGTHWRLTPRTTARA